MKTTLWTHLLRQPAISTVASLLLAFGAQAQIPSFTTYGDASSSGGSCYELTPNAINKKGAIWSNTQMDLNDPFVLCFQANFGNKDGNGADGIAFVIKDPGASFLGGDGGALGIRAGNGNATVTPSLAIEFDDFDNSTSGNGWLGDLIPDDHIALVKDGDLNNPLFGPQGINLGAGNIDLEDGVTHDMQVIWDPMNTLLTLNIDGVQQMSQIIDISTIVFSGNTIVDWGFTAGTGNLFNEQSLCVTSYVTTSAMFTAHGSAQALGSTCYRLTSSSQNQTGVIWSQNLIDMNNPFSICFDAYFGDDVSGADGIAFVLKQDAGDIYGGNGGALGVMAGNGNSAVTPSFTIEFDDFDNTNPSNPVITDIAADHIAYNKDGDFTTPLSGPTALVGTTSLEDGNYHEIRIEWSGTGGSSLQFDVWIDNVQQAGFSPALYSDILSSNQVYFGFAAATGLYHNRHEVCNIAFNCFTCTHDVCEKPDFNAIYSGYDQHGYPLAFSTEGTSVKSLENCDYLVAGSWAGQSTDATPAIMRFDNNGDPLWITSYSHLSNESGIFNNVEQTDVGDIVACGKLLNINTMAYEPIITLTDYNGGVYWTRSFVGAWNAEYVDVEVMHDGNIVAVANDNGEPFVSMFDQAGSELWTLRYLGTNGEPMTLNSIEQVAKGSDGIADDGFVIVGEINVFGIPHAVVFEIDQSGTVLWTDFIEYANSMDVQQIDIDLDGRLDNGSYAITGKHYDGGLLLLIYHNYVLNNSAKLQDPNDPQIIITGEGIAQLANGSLQVVGSVDEYGSLDALIYNCDLQLNTLESMTLGSPDQNDYLTSVDMMGGGQYVTVGASSEITGDPDRTEMYLTKRTVGLSSFCEVPLELDAHPVDQGLTPNITTVAEYTTQIELVSTEQFMEKNEPCFLQKRGTNGSSEHEMTANFSVYPNPTSGRVDIQLEEATSGTIHVLDVFGKVVFTKSLNAATNEQLNLSELPAGVYFLQFETDLWQQTQRIIKQ